MSPQSPPFRGTAIPCYDCQTLPPALKRYTLSPTGLRDSYILGTAKTEMTKMEVEKVGTENMGVVVVETVVMGIMWVERVCV